jgi:hypothetical protein
MKKKAWDGFVAARSRFRDLVRVAADETPGLKRSQQELISRRDDGGYAVETPVVFNRALDEIQQSGVIKLILAADNPGRREQAAENRRYLVGPSGKLAEKFFREFPGLGVEYPSQALILNKTPIHTPRTLDLRELCRIGGEAVAQCVEASQREMAQLLLDFHRALAPVPLWIIGYSQLKRGGIFQVYWETLREIYRNEKTRREELRLYRHFSMSQFTGDLHRQTLEGEDPLEALDRMGIAYRMSIMGW